MDKLLTQPLQPNLPRFTAERSLGRAALRYSSRPVGPTPEANDSLVAQLRIGSWQEAGNTCDGCDTFSYSRCVMDCGTAGTDCTRKCLTRSFECSVCNGPFVHRGSFGAFRF